MSHTTKASGGTTFIHNGGYDGDVHILVRGIPGVVTDSADVKYGEITVPFADLRELVLGYLRDKVTEAVENTDDPVFEQMLIGGAMAAMEGATLPAPVTPAEAAEHWGYAPAKLYDWLTPEQRLRYGPALHDSTIREALRIAVTAAENAQQAERFEAALAAMDREEA